MIYSSLKAQSAQCKWPEPFQKAFDFLKNSDLEHMEVGRYEIDGDDIYAMIQKQTTAAPENKKAESHYKYIDIQYLIRGEEMHRCRREKSGRSIRNGMSCTIRK